MHLHDPNKPKHNPARICRNMWFLLKYAMKYDPKYIILCLADALCSGIATILSVLFTKYLFDAIERGESFWRILVVIILLIAYQAAQQLFFLWRYEVYRPQAELRIHEGVQREFYAKARSLDQSCYDDPEFYNDFIWAIREADLRTYWIVGNLSVFPKLVISIVGIFSILVYMDWIVALFFVLVTVANFFLQVALNKIRYQKKTEQNPIGRKIDYVGRVFYIPEFAKEIRQGEMTKKFEAELEATYGEHIKCEKKFGKKIFGLSMLSSLVSGTVPQIAVSGYLIVRYIFDSTLSLGTFSASITASLQLYYLLEEISQFFVVFNEHSLYIERVRKFLGYEPKVRGEISDVPEFESLTVRNVNFAYPHSKEKKYVLKNVNIDIQKGEKIAIVGYNGAGKTTLIKLLMRLYDTDEGEILYNGKNAKEYAPENYREHIGAVFQDYKIFAATLAENVLGGEYTDADEERVLAALRAASFEEKLKTLPNGIHSQLTREFSSEGVGLSGGEAQKVAISRVFARPFDLIIMDEPSSALDPVAEYELNQSILKNAADKTVIFISHRLSTTRMADKIYMFDNGELIESGSHDELMALGGKYAEMYTVQAKKYKL